MQEITENKMFKLKNKYLKCFDESHNANNVLCSDTKLVVIGTITPKKFDYFYCSPRNRIFGYIDEVVGSHLKELKIMLNASKNKSGKQTKIVEIKKILTDNKIAFVDAMKYVIRDKDKINSHDDTAIKYYSIDENTLKTIKDYSIIICNSRLSQDIVSKIFNIDKNDLTYIPQRGKNSTKSNWVSEIKEKLYK